MAELNKTPYLSLNGSTGYRDITTTKETVDVKLSELRSLGIPMRLLMGVQTSHTTQVLEEANSYGENWFPVSWRGLQSVAHAMGRHAALHINPKHTDVDYLESFTNLVRSNCRYVADVSSGADPRYGIVNPVSAVQFNQLPWHESDYSEYFARNIRLGRFTTQILQASPQQTDNLAPRLLVEALKPYGESVSHVLLDDSCGRGVALDYEKLRPYIEQIAVAPDMPSIAVAGGLTPDNLEQLVGRLLIDYPDTSVDVDSGLRSGHANAMRRDTSFSTQKAEAFTAKYVELMKKSKIIRDYLAIT